MKEVRVNEREPSARRLLLSAGLGRSYVEHFLSISLCIMASVASTHSVSAENAIHLFVLLLNDCVSSSDATFRVCGRAFNVTPTWLPTMLFF